MKIHYFQHVPYEGIGYIEQWALENQHSISYTKFYEKQYFFPELNDIDTLIIMGGPMGANDESAYPWMEKEKVFIKNCIAEKKKLLGICLGAQLIAACLNAKVSKAPETEIGWFPVYPTELSKNNFPFYDCFAKGPIVFHWHGDQFKIPNDAKELLFSEANRNQAFSYKEHVLGLQFHLEVTENGLREMLQNGAEELSQKMFVQSIEEIEEGKIHIKNCHLLIKKLLDSWMA